MRTPAKPGSSSRVDSLVKPRGSSHPPRVSGPWLSVVIPALDERASLARALGSTSGPGVERIVVDGGSVDGTPDAARALGAEQVLVSGRGRARQMQTGFRASRGEVVLFLHADTRLETGWAASLRRATEEPGVAGGAFHLRFESPRAVYRFIERGARARCRVARLPYGDQGIFVRRNVLDELGGIPDTPIFEDLDLARAMRRFGRVVLLPQAAFTSPRRYERNGPLRTMLRNWIALGAWALGADRERVVRWYRGAPER